VAAEVERLMKLAKSSDFETARDAIFALGSLGPKAKAALPLLREIHRSGKKYKDDRTLKLFARRAIAKIQQKKKPGRRSSRRRGRGA
jgi:hypothetical protein